eukprot:g958.t1
MSLARANELCGVPCLLRLLCLGGALALPDLPGQDVLGLRDGDSISVDDVKAVEEAFESHFSLVDKDGDGQLSYAEFDARIHEAMVAHVKTAAHRARQEAELSFQRMDTDGDQKLVKEEFLAQFDGLDEAHPKDKEGQANIASLHDHRIWERKKFAHGDKDKNGALDGDEFFNITFPEHAGSQDDFQLLESQHFIDQHDDDKDGTLSFDEIKRAITDYDAGEHFEEYDQDSNGQLSADEVRDFQFPDVADTRTEAEEVEDEIGFLFRELLPEKMQEREDIHELTVPKSECSKHMHLFVHTIAGHFDAYALQHDEL